MTYDEFEKHWRIKTPCSSGVGDGWVPLLDKLLEELCLLGLDPSKDIAQIKEKFGGLRFYLDVQPNGAEDLIRKAEIESYSICEVCGAPGCLMDGGWLKTLCEKHAEGRKQYKRRTM